jgi:hypothetical protein
MKLPCVGLAGQGLVDMVGLKMPFINPAPSRLGRALKHFAQMPAHPAARHPYGFSDRQLQPLNPLAQAT